MTAPRFLERVRIGPKLLVLFLLLAIVPLAAVALVNDRQSSEALHRASRVQLEALSATKARQIEWWFDEQRQDIAALSRFDDVARAAKAFEAGLASGADSSLYLEAETAYRDLLADYLAEHGHHDIYLITASGDIVYSVRDQPGSGANVLVGPNAVEGLGVAFRGAVAGEFTVTDLTQHGEDPDHLSPIFAAPVYDRAGVLVGVVALHPAPDDLNAIMAEREGLGESGETYIVGPDLLMRSQSRFAAEPSALARRVDTEAARAGLRQETGTGVIKGYRGEPVLSVWRPLNVGDLSWILVAEIDEAEVNAPSTGLRNNHILVAAMAALVVVGVAALVTRWFTRPIRRVSEALSAIAEGDVTRSPGVFSGDEIGDMTRSYDRMRSYLTTLADAANRVAGGDLSAGVEPQSERDVLGTAFATMISSVGDAQGALRESEERYRDLYENANDIIYTTDIEGRITSANAAAERMSGYTQAELQEFSTPDFVLPAHRGRAEASLAGRRAGRPPLGRQVFAFVTKAGEEVWLEIRGRTMFDRGGTATGIHVIARNVTDRVAAEAALRESEERYRALFETSQNAILMVDAGGRIALANRAASEVFGYPTEELVGLDASHIVEPEEADDVRAWKEARMRGEPAPDRYHGRRLRKDGTVLEMEIAAATFSQGGRVVGMLAEYRDVTAETAARDQTARSAAETASILQAAPNAIVLFDEEGSVLRVNPAAGELFGWDADELPGKNVAMLMLEPHRGAQSGYMRHYLKSGEPSTDLGVVIGRAMEVTALRRDGSQFPLELSVAEIASSDGTRHFAAVMQDITERKDTERNRELAHRATVRSQFLSTMSHELRSPLNSVLGFAELLEEDTSEPLSERQRLYVQDIRAGGEQLLALVNDILDFSRIDAGRHELEPRPCQPTTVIDAAVQSFRAMAEEKRLDLQTSVDDVPAALVADERALRQIVTNLISNALKFTDEGHVEVRASEQKNHLVLDVTDTGIGIPREQLDIVFEAFSQVDSGLARRHGGTGLGLAITKQLVEMHGGTIEVDSEPGRGSTFTVRLPLDGPPEEGSRAST